MINGDDSYGRSNRGAANNQSVNNAPKPQNLGYGSGPYKPAIPAIGTSQTITKNTDQFDHMF